MAPSSRHASSNRRLPVALASGCLGIVGFVALGCLSAAIAEQLIPGRGMGPGGPGFGMFPRTSVVVAGLLCGIVGGTAVALCADRSLSAKGRSQSTDRAALPGADGTSWAILLATWLGLAVFPICLLLLWKGGLEWADRGVIAGPLLLLPMALLDWWKPRWGGFGLLVAAGISGASAFPASNFPLSHGGIDRGYLSLLLVLVAAPLAVLGGALLRARQ
ncbi:MAG: hypothetical protein KF774_05025 [Planctomyces sp.]|nr:hypothetical protein [Planctomyces sp.]